MQLISKCIFIARRRNADKEKSIHCRYLQLRYKIQTSVCQKTNTQLALSDSINLQPAPLSLRIPWPTSNAEVTSVLRPHPREARSSLWSETFIFVQLEQPQSSTHCADHIFFPRCLHQVRHRTFGLRVSAAPFSRPFDFLYFLIASPSRASRWLSFPPSPESPCAEPWPLNPPSPTGHRAVSSMG